MSLLSVGSSFRSSSSLSGSSGESLDFASDSGLALAGSRGSLENSTEKLICLCTRRVANSTRVVRSDSTEMAGCLIFIELIS